MTNATTTQRTRRGAPAGSAPGTLIADPNAPKPEVRIMAFGESELVEREVEDLESLRDTFDSHRVTWINVDGLGDVDVLRRLGEIFGLDPLCLEDIHNVVQRPKVEPYADYLFMVFRMPRPGEPFSTEQVSVVLSERWVLTFQERVGDCFDPVRERVRRRGPRLWRSGPDYLAYALLDAVVDSYFPALERLGDEIDASEDEILGTDSGDDTLSRIHGIKRELLAFDRVVWPLRDAINALYRDESELIDERTRVYLRDCHDHASQLSDLVESRRELAKSLMELYLTVTSNKMNEVMKVLTIIATVFIPLTFIAGIYGMNFSTESPWNMPELAWRYGYPACLGVMAVVGFAFFVYFKRKRWL